MNLNHRPLTLKQVLCNAELTAQKLGSPGRTLTSAKPVNSRLLYRLSYGGIRIKSWKRAMIKVRHTLITTFFSNTAHLTPPPRFVNNLKDIQ